MDVNKILQPDLEFFGILVQEPVTTITNLIISAACLYAFWRLYKEQIPGNTVIYMKLYFVTMGMATSIGGLIGHGFLYAFDQHWKLLGWFLSMVSITLIERSAIEYAKRLINPMLSKIFLIINLVELFIFMAITAFTLHFRYVEIHCIYGLLVVVFSFHLFIYLKTKDKGSRYMLYTIVVLTFAAFVFNYPIIVHTWFNHRDLAHILMTISTILLLQGARNMGKLKYQMIKTIGN